MDSLYPSASINHCHAFLNALRAVLHGEESRLLSRHLLGLEEQDEKLTLLSSNVQYVEELFSSFQSDETIILCLDDTRNDATTKLFHKHLSVLAESANSVEKMVQNLHTRNGDPYLLSQEIATYIVGHTRARETYIDGLLNYADTFQLSEMIDHWSSQFYITQQGVEEAKNLLVDLNNKYEYSNFMYHRVYESAVSVPASFRCQLHDMLRVLYLDDQEFTFDLAHFTPDEAKPWIELGVDAELAGYWRAYSIPAEEFLTWNELGFQTASQAGSWKIRGFSAEQAAEWQNSGIEPSEADTFRLSGYNNPIKALSLKQTHQ